MRRGCLIALLGGATGLIALIGTGAYLRDRIHLRPGHAVIDRADFGTRYEPARLRADFAAMIATMRHIHPNFGAVVDPDAFAETERRVQLSLNRAMTRVEAWRIMAAVNGQIRDGHSALLRPDEEWHEARSKHGFLPANLELDDGGIRIRRSYDSRIPQGVRVRALNGHSAAFLRDWVTDRISGETIEVRRSFGQSRLNEYLWLFGLRPPYQISWSDDLEASRSAVVHGISSAEFDRKAEAYRGRPFTLQFRGSAAILRIDSFDEPESNYSAFLDEAFTVIQNRRPSALIVDLRNNGGGASTQGDLLQSYLSDQILPGLREVRIKTTAEVKARYRTLMPPGFRWIPINMLEPNLRAIQKSPDNHFLVTHPEPERPTDRRGVRKQAFRGPVYILIGRNTYSSAVIFAAPLAYWRRATLVGQSTGEPLTFYGDNYEFDLPGSRIQASVSHKQFRLLGRGRPDSGLQPDVVVDDEQDALEVALRLADQGAGQSRSSGAD